MIETPMDVLSQFPVRRSGKQKQAFRDAVRSYAGSLGYDTRVEQGSRGCQNIIIGDPETASFLITAHYDTPAGSWAPHFLAPCDPVLFVLSQLLTVLIQFLPALAVTGLTAWLAPGAWYPVMAAMLVLTLALMLFGPANPRNANNNTSGVVALLEIAASMPAKLRSQVCFALFDRNEPAMAGAAFHRRKHKYASDLQTVINLDCVGSGDTLMLMPGKGLRAEEEKMNRLLDLERTCGEKQVLVRDKGFAYPVSDQLCFPRSICVCALHKNRLGYCTGRIHTFRDTVLEYTNINILRACLITYISSAVE